LRQEITNGILQIQWIPTTEMPADGLTKALPKQRFDIFVKQLVEMSAECTQDEYLPDQLLNVFIDH
jgi:hypothetical protein